MSSETIKWLLSLDPETKAQTIKELDEIVDKLDDIFAYVGFFGEFDHGGYKILYSDCNIFLARRGR